MKKVSIIMPVYNVEPSFLQEAVASALAQTYPDKELIIVDDGSTRPDTLQYLESLKQDSVMVFHQENQGPSAARNLGITHSSGDYILPLDADDIIEPTYVQEACDILDSNPKIGIVYCLADMFGDINCSWDLPPYSYPEILISNCIFCTSLFRKSDWEKVGGYKTVMRLGWEDYEFFLSLIERGFQVYRIPKILFHYRKSGISRTTNSTVEENGRIMWADIRRLHQRMFYSNLCFLHRHKAPIYITWKQLPLSEKIRELFGNQQK
ncbi:MAG: glycosyltransferase [Bacteroidales bacterium]|nr:glycosyltransferase [Bacteroidales bacterium]